MASKGDRAVLEPTAMRLYAGGNTLSAISEQLGVSVTSLSKWKADSKRPDIDLDEWDRARAQKRSNIQRLRDLFEQELADLESQPAGGISVARIDALSKLGALVQRWDAAEKVLALATPKETEEGGEAKQPGVSLETINAIRRDVLRMGE